MPRTPGSHVLKTKDIGITYGGKIKIPLGLAKHPDRFFESTGMHAYHDSSYGKAPFPWGGYAVVYANGAIAWKAGKPTIVPGSTAHAELMVGSKTANETGAVRSVLSDMRCPVAGPTPLLGDSQAARNIIIKDSATLRTRHFDDDDQAALRAPCR